MDMKPYPCCRSAHCAIDCSLKLRDSILEKIGKEYDHKTLEEERKRLTEAIREIEIKTYEVGYKQCAVSDGCYIRKIPWMQSFPFHFVQRQRSFLEK